MAGHTSRQKTFDLPRPRRTAGFSLLPLADCMLQLLIFFMLSSGMSMYSLLPLRQGEAPGSGPTASDVPDAESGRAGQVVWTVDAGAVLANGQRLGMAALPELARAAASQSEVEVLLIAAPTASVQDMVLVLEALGAAGIEAVTIAASGA